MSLIHIKPNNIVTESYINQYKNNQLYLTDDCVDEATDLLIAHCSNSLKINSIENILEDLKHLKEEMYRNGNTRFRNSISSHYPHIWLYAGLISFWKAYFLDGPLHIDIDNFNYDKKYWYEGYGNGGQFFTFPFIKDQGVFISKDFLDYLRSTNADGLKFCTSIKYIEFEDTITQGPRYIKPVWLQQAEYSRRHSFIIKLPAQLEQLTTNPGFLDKNSARFVFKPVEIDGELVSPFVIDEQLYYKYRTRKLPFLGLQ